MDTIVYIDKQLMTKKILDIMITMYPKYTNLRKDKKEIFDNIMDNVFGDKKNEYIFNKLDDNIFEDNEGNIVNNTGELIGYRHTNINQNDQDNQDLYIYFNNNIDDNNYDNLLNELNKFDKLCN